MIAQITESGDLVVVPETGTEAYALQRWIEGLEIPDVLDIRTEVPAFLNEYAHPKSKWMRNMALNVAGCTSDIAEK